MTGPLRLYSLLGRREHTVLLYADDAAGAADVATFERAANAVAAAAHAQMDGYLGFAAAGIDVDGVTARLRGTFA